MALDVLNMGMLRTLFQRLLCLALWVTLLLLQAGWVLPDPAGARHPRNEQRFTAAEAQIYPAWEFCGLEDPGLTGIADLKARLLAWAAELPVNGAGLMAQSVLGPISGPPDWEALPAVATAEPCNRGPPAGV